MSRGIEYGRPSKKLEEFLRLQFALKVFERQHHGNDPEADALRKQISQKFSELSQEEKTFLTLRNRLAG